MLTILEERKGKMAKQIEFRSKVYQPKDYVDQVVLDIFEEYLKKAEGGGLRIKGKPGYGPMDGFVGRRQRIYSDKGYCKLEMRLVEEMDGKRVYKITNLEWGLVSGEEDLPTMIFKVLKSRPDLIKAKDLKTLIRKNFNFVLDLE